MRSVIVLVLVLMFLISACSQTKTGDDIYDKDMGSNDSAEKGSEEEAVAEYRKITPEEAKDMMIEGNMILDVRTQQEYNDGHIPEAVLIPHDIILAGDLEQLPDKDQTILVYCRSGNRSGQAAKALVEAGYTAVYDFGGINAWPYEVEQ